VYQFGLLLGLEGAHLGELLGELLALELLDLVLGLHALHGALARLGRLLEPLHLLEPLLLRPLGPDVRIDGRVERRQQRSRHTTLYSHVSTTINY
jgi:hypothetical protein